MATSLTKVTDRAGLKARRDPYWQRVRKGCYLGFRKMSPTSEGTWLARARDELTGKQLHQPLGDFGSHPPSERYDKALAEANAWFTHLGQGGRAESSTVRAACEAYVEHLRDQGREQAADDAEKRFQRWVYSDVKFASSELSKLRRDHFVSWRKKLKAAPIRGAVGGGQRSDSALNRDMTSLRAALNKALNDGAVTSDHAWRVPLSPVKNADRRRDLYLDRDQRRKLIAAADADLAQFLTGLCWLPLRPGALANLTVAHYDKRLKTLTVGKDKHGKDRKLLLPDEAAAFIGGLTAAKLPSAPLFARATGGAWDKDAWKHPIEHAVERAKLPSQVVAYTLRHSVITDLVHSGVDTLTVAQMSGTSVAMIERYYGHLRQEHAKKALATLAL